MQLYKHTKLVSAAVTAVTALSILGSATFAQAATLSSGQVNAIVGLLQSFGADPSVVTNVQIALLGNSSSGISSNATSSSDATSELHFTIRLKKGMSGEEVEKLQKILASDPDLLTLTNVTGFFGPKTEEAVRKLQKHFGISQVGQVGPQTIEKLNELLDEHNIQENDTIDENEFGDLNDSDSSDLKDSKDHSSASSTNATSSKNHRDD